MITQRTLDAIRERIELVSRFADRRPRKSGSGRHVCSCPWCHADDPKSDCLTLYPDGTFHCFACRAHGDLFEAVMLREAVDFAEAVERLAREAGVEIERVERGDPTRAAAKRTELAAAFAAADWATAWMADQLAGDRGRAAMGYLRVDRRLPEDLIRSRRLGWAPGDALIAAAKGAGHTVEALMGAGLVIERDGNRRSAFYERVVIPILNPNGRVVAWTARALPDAIKAASEQGRNIPKYLNPSDTLLYSKAKHLLGIREARDGAKAAGSLIVVEGALDVLALAAMGMAAGICACGLSLSEDQVGTLGDLAEHAGVPVTLLYDGDQAGRDGAIRNTSSLLQVGVRARVATLPSPVKDAHGDQVKIKDAADVWEKLGDAGAAVVRAALDVATPAIDYLLAAHAPAVGAMDDFQRLGAADKLLSIVNPIADDDRRDLALERIAKHLSMSRKQLADRSERQRVAEAKHDSVPAGKAPEGDWGFAIPPGDPLADAPPKESVPFELNDLGNALRFAARYGKVVRYVATYGSWLTWTGTHWEADKRNQVAAWMLEAIDASCRAERADSWDRARRAPRNSRDAEGWQQRAIELERWRVKNLSARAVANSLITAQSLRCLILTNDQLDSDANLFAVKNGWLDLKTGELHAHDPLRYYTRCCPIVYDPKASDARWERFLLDCCGHTSAATDNERTEALARLDFLQRYAGYCATGETLEQAVLMITGPGGNGKSLWANSLQRILGGYAYAADFAIFLASHGERQKWTLANLEKTRALICEESAEGKRFSADLMKKVTGETSIEAEAKGRQPFTYSPQFKVIFVTNHPPRVSDLDEAFWRRMRMVRFDYVPTRADRNLPAHFRSEIAQRAILAWVVAGARAWHATGLTLPVSIAAAGKTYRFDQDPISEYLADRTIWAAAQPADRPLEGLAVAKSELRQDYLAWCRLRGVDPISDRNLAFRLRALGADDKDCHTVAATTGNSERAWSGFRILVSGIDNGRPTGPAQRLSTAAAPDNTSAATPLSSPSEGRSAEGAPLATDQPTPEASRHWCSPGPSVAGSVAPQTGSMATTSDDRQQDNTSVDTSPPSCAHGRAGARAGAHAHATRAGDSSVVDDDDKKNKGSPDPKPGSRGAKLRQPPGPGEDLFAAQPEPPPDQPPAPPLREPGADEDEPWPPPTDQEPNP